MEVEKLCYNGALLQQMICCSVLDTFLAAQKSLLLLSGALLSDINIFLPLPTDERFSSGGCKKSEEPKDASETDSDTDDDADNDDDNDEDDEYSGGESDVNRDSDDDVVKANGAAGSDDDEDSDDDDDDGNDDDDDDDEDEDDDDGGRPLKKKK